jgi:hypothetical protein
VGGADDAWYDFVRGKVGRKMVVGEMAKETAAARR